MTAMVIEEITKDEYYNMEQDLGKNQEGKEEETAAQIAAPTLSKSWSIASAHVPTYTGGKIIHCHTKGMRYLHGKPDVPLTKTTTEGEDDDDEAGEQENVPPEKTQFLLLPVGGDLALVDARRGIKARTIRHGALSPTAVSKTTSGSKGDDDNDIIDDEDDDGIDADAITAFALSNNDEMIVTCSPNHLIRMYSLELPWDINQPAPIQKTWGRSGHSLPVTHMEFHPSNVFLATGSVDGTVRIWDVRGAYVTHVFRPYGADGGSGMGGMQAVTALSWRQDVSQLVIAIGRDNGSIVIHDLREDETTAPPVVLNDHVSAVTCVDWGKGSSAINNVFVSTGRDAVINTWKILQKQDQGTDRKINKKQSKKKGNKRKGQPQVQYQRVHTLPIYEQVEGMVIMPFDKEKANDFVIATAGSEGTVRLWKATVDEEHDTISGFTSLAKQPENESFGSDRGGYMELRYNARGLSLKEERGPSSTTTPSSSWMEQLIVADAEHNLSFLSAKMTNDESALSKRPLLSADRTIVGHNDEILDLKVIPSSSQLNDASLQSSERIVVATNSAQVRLFELGTFSCEVLDGHSATVLCVDVSPCGRYLATCGKDKTMRLWHVETQSCIAVATGHTEAIGAAALSRKLGRYDVKGKAAINGGGSFAVTASKDRTLKRWNLPGSDELDSSAQSEEHLELRAFVSARAHEKDINIVSVAPNDSLVATGSQDKTVKLWRSTDLSLQGTLKGHRRGVWDCQFSPFDRVIATASADRTVKLWSLSDYSCVRTFQGHVSSALRVRFLSGGLQLVSSGADGLIKVWTIRTNECETTMDGHNDKVWALDLSPDSGSLVTGGADSQIVVWNDTTQEEENAKRDAEEQTIMMEQRLANHLRFKEYEQALEIALELDKPRQALKVLNSIIENDLRQGHGQLVTLQRHVQSWPMSRTSQVLRYCREWNTRARNSNVAMLVVRAIVSSIPAHELAAADGVPELMAGITPYAERHFDRLDRLHASSYLLDFTLFSMGAMDNDEDDNLETDYAAWETSSKLVLPPKHVDGRIQIGGRDVIGKGSAKQDDDSDDDDNSENDVMTIGESDDDDSSTASSDDDSSVDDDDQQKEGDNSDESSTSS